MSLLTRSVDGADRSPNDTRGGVHVRNVTRRFADRTVLDGIDLDIAPGEFVALLGASGSGKSTLLRIIAGLDPDADGQVEVPARLAIVFQEHRLLPWQKVWRNVTLGLDGKGRRALARDALAEVGLAGHLDAWPGTLSGGESQRVALARALVRDPQLMLLDEPFGALDALTRLTAQTLVAELWQQHRPAVLLVTHDVEEAVLLADRALVLEHGRIVRQVVVDVPRPRSIDHPRFVALRAELLGALGVRPDLSLNTQIHQETT